MSRAIATASRTYPGQRSSPRAPTCGLERCQDCRDLPMARREQVNSRREQMEVAEMLGSSFPGLVQSPGKRRFGSFGPQRAFVKVSGD